MYPLAQKLISLSFIILLTSCGGGGTSVNPSEFNTITTNLTGSVGDGPVTNAAVALFDGNDAEIGTTSSDDQARYSFQIPENTALPITVRATSGLDLVTGRPLEFELISVVGDVSGGTANVSPLTTLQNYVAGCMAPGFNAGEAKVLVEETTAMGLVGVDHQYGEVDATNAAAFVRANEALGEVVRRVSNSLGSVNQQEVLERMGCDLADGNINGSGQSDSRTAALVHSTMAVVLLETMANSLRVDGTDSTARMNEAVMTIAPQASVFTDQLPVSSQVRDQLQRTLSLLQALEPSQDIVELQVLLATKSLVELPQLLSQGLSDNIFSVLEALPSALATAPQSTLDSLAAIATEAESSQPAQLAFTTSQNAVQTGGSVDLTWSASNANSCIASGSWNGSQQIEGSITIPVTDPNTRFELTCFGAAGVVSETREVQISLTAQPELPPSIDINSSKQTIANGDSITLTWQADSASTCVASGGWSGAKNVSGSETVVNVVVSEIFELTCSGAGGDTTVSSSVSVVDPASPQISFTGSSQSVNYGGGLTLDWSVANATSCTASGDWSGSQNTSGSRSFDNLTENAGYTLSCVGVGGSSSAAVNTSVLPAPLPTLSFTSSTVTATLGDNLQLSWESTNADSCVASEGWSGAKPPSDTETILDIAANTTFKLSCTGQGGNVDRTISVVVESIGAPSVNLTSSLAAVQEGTSATLSWTTARAESCVASGAWGGNRALSGSADTGALSQNSSYVLTCTGAGGQSVDTINVAIQAVGAPQVTITTSTASVDAGGAATLTWSSVNATSCVASGNWSGNKSTSGNESTGGLTQNSNFALTCSGLGGEDLASANVAVAGPPSPQITLSVSAATVQSGDSATLTWSADNAASCVASGDWSGAKSTSGSTAIGPLSQNSNFVLTCTGTGGQDVDSVNVAVTPLDPPQVNLSSSNTSIQSGESVTLTWSSSDASSCTASNAWTSSRAVIGSISIGPLSQTSTFVLTCTGAGGQGVASTNVTVAAPNPPQLSFSASSTTIASGGSATLTWSTTDAASCTASGDWSGTKPTSGSAIMSNLTQNTSYTLGCTGIGGNQSATVNITVQEPDVSVQLNSTASWIARSGSTTLSWTSAGANACVASGDWSGNKSISGSEAVGPLIDNSSYTLTCSNSSDSAIGLTDVSIRQATMSWGVPTQNSNGTPLNDLAGYRIHWGTTSGVYSSSQDINNAQQTSLAFELTPGTYYFSITSVNNDGVESEYAPEQTKVIE